MQFPALVSIVEGPEFVCTFANPLFSKLYEGKQLVGKTVREFVPEFEGQGYFDLLDRVYRTGEPFYGFSYPGTADWKSDGKPSTKYFNFVYFPYRIDGQVAGIICFGLEVTDQVQAIREVGRQQEFIHTISKAAITALWVLDQDMNCIFINDTWVQWTGKPLEEHLGRGWLNCLVPEDREETYRHLATHVRNRTTFNHEYRINKADGEVIWCLSSGSPWYHTNGEFGGFAGSAVDITDKKEEEQRLKSIVDALPIIAWTAKSDGELNYFNKRWYEYTGQTPEQSLGSGWANTMPPEFHQITFQRWHYSLQHKVRYEIECKYRRHDGEYRWYIAQAEPIKNSKGEIVLWLGTSTDIHDQKTVSESLEKLVEQRTKDLIASNRELQRSNKDLEQFAYAASHDLKEPLRKVQFFSNLLLEQPGGKPEPNLVYTEKIREASNRMMGLIEALLGYARLSKSPEHFETVDLNEVLQVVTQDFELLIRDKRASLVLDPLPTLNAIPHQMHQLFSNLVGNALKYSQMEVPPQIRIWCEEASREEIEPFSLLDKGRRYMAIRLQDNGIGFESAQAEKIFTIFQRLHSKDTYKGSGIGLALCRRVVHNHEGEIYATAEPGRGATFSILLPYPAN